MRWFTFLIDTICFNTVVQDKKLIFASSLENRLTSTSREFTLNLRHRGKTQVIKTKC